MNITHGSKLQYESPNISHRGSGLGFKILSLGDENDTKNNHFFALGKQRDFYSPRHKHNFDQFRYAYQGSFNLSDHLTLHEGELAYHPEGVEYGPQSDGPEERILLVLQCGGASGQGFLSHRQLKQANVELEKQGRFEKGRFVNAEDGSEKDGFQALWELTMGRELVYPRARYFEPVVLRPEAFEWRKVESGRSHGGLMNGEVMETGVRGIGAFKRTLGVFSERELRVEGLKLVEGGEVQIPGDDAIHLLFVLRGSGSVLGEEALEQESCIRLPPGCGTHVRCSEGELELLHFIMPIVS